MRLVAAISAMLVTVAAPALAADTCLVKAVMGGKPVVMKNCAVAVYDDKGVTLFFSESPIGADERATFEMNSYPKDTDPQGKPRTMMEFGFCPGGGKSEASPGAVKSVELSMSYAGAGMLQRQWVFELPKDKELRIEKLTGTAHAGGRIAGRITGARTSDNLKYSWQVDFDLALPAKNAAAGIGCGD